MKAITKFLFLQSGRDRQQRERKEREKSEVDLELDFLAPFLAKYPTDLTYQQALSVREECLISIKVISSLPSNLINFRWTTVCFFYENFFESNFTPLIVIKDCFFLLLGIYIFPQIWYLSGVYQSPDNKNSPLLPVLHHLHPPWFLFMEKPKFF